MPLGNHIRNDVIEVVIHKGRFDFEKALKRFSALWKNSGTLRELKRRRDYPSIADRRRDKARRAVSRRRRGPH